MKRISLNGKWKFFADEKNQLKKSSAYKNPLKTKHTVPVPSPIQDIKYLGKNYPSIAMNNAYLGTAWLETEFEINEINEYTMLVFDGVFPYATVFVNGKKAGAVTNGHIAHRFDISNFITRGKNRLTVIIEEKNSELLGGLRFDVLNWSGIYGDVSLISDKKAVYGSDFTYCNVLEGYFNIGCEVETELNLSYEIKILDSDTNSFIMQNTMQKNQNIIEASFPIKNMKLWSPEEPYCYKAEIIARKDNEFFNSHSFDFGLRELKTSNTKIYINEKPIYIFGGGEEYFSVDISPLRDRSIIRKRFNKLKEMGFNFFRYHTHFPSKEEIEEADKAGILLSAEIPLLSNFNQITNSEKGYEILKNYIKQTRVHPSMAVYCLGNEGAQLLVKNKNSFKIARKGYNIIKENTKNQLGIICFGFQGEVDELKNDIWTPHIWSQDFRWAYQGMTQTPLDFLEAAVENHPSVIHEYGKFGVWPNPKLDSYIRKTGYKLSIKEYNKSIFSGNKDLYKLLPNIIKNSNFLMLECAKISIESIRRKNYLSGYIYWTIFLMGLRSSGFCDDYGNECIVDSKILKNGPNSPLGIFIDKDFKGRTFYSTQKDKLNITVSNFSQNDITNASVKCKIYCGDKVLEDFRKDNISIALGETDVKACFEYNMPFSRKETELKIELFLEKDEKILCHNSSTIWCYPINRAELIKGTVMHIKDKGLSDNIYSSVNNITDIWDYISIVLGCHIPECGFYPNDDEIVFYIKTALKKKKPSFFITDQFDSTAKIMLKNHVPVFFMDSGNFPKNFYPEKIPANNCFADLNTFYAPFRSGWDEGNTATIIKETSYFTEQTEDTYADIRYFDMINGAMPLLTNEVIKATKMRDADIQFRLIQKIKDLENVTENSSVYFEKIQPKKINDCFYCMVGKINGTPCIITSCSFFKDANGKYIFKKISEEFPYKNQ